MKYIIKNDINELDSVFDNTYLIMYILLVILIMIAINIISYYTCFISFQTNTKSENEENLITSEVKE